MSMPKVYLSPEDRASNAYAAQALWNGKPTNEKEQMGRCADYLETALKRCGFDVVNAQFGNMYDRVKASNAWPADLHIALHTNGFNGKVAGTRVHCYPSAESRRRKGSSSAIKASTPGFCRPTLLRMPSGVSAMCCRSSDSTTIRRRPSG